MCKCGLQYEAINHHPVVAGSAVLLLAMMRDETKPTAKHIRAGHIPSVILNQAHSKKLI
jgi:hypothetical protein